MAITSKHPEYELRFPQWERCRDAYEGSDAVKGKGEKYLPRLSRQETAEYAAYKGRALWYGGTQRTVQGLLGAVFRREPRVEFPTEEWLEDITLTGIGLEGFAKQALNETLLTGRYGILVDYPDETAPELERRPYLVGYTAEQVINWRSVWSGGKHRLLLVVLKELTYQPSEAEAYEWEPVERYRLLYLDEAGYYVQRRFLKEEDKDEIIEEGEAAMPTRRGERLDFIPFYFVNPTNTLAETEKPPLLDLVDLNYSHYRSSADLEHGRHFTALPTPWIAARNLEQTTLRIGADKAWTLPEGSSVGMLEFTGQGLSALKEALEEKQLQMAAIGARILEEQKRAAEAAETHRLRQAGEHSVLASIAGTVESALTESLWLSLWWHGAEDPQVEVELNRDFYDAQMDPALLREVVGLLMSSAISFETFYFILERGEMYPPGHTLERELEQIRAGIPTVSTGVVNSGTVVEDPSQDSGSGNADDQGAADAADSSGVSGH